MAGLLGDIYSYIDSKKRGLLDAVQNPGDALSQFVGNMGDNQNRLSGLMNDAGWMPIAKSNATPQQSALAQALLAEHGSQMGLAGAIDPKAQKVFIDGLSGVGNTERYRLGDIKPAQARSILEHDKSASPTALDVFVSPGAERHIQDKRVFYDGFTPGQTGDFAKQAMRADSTVMPPKGFGDYPSLLSQQMTDGDTGRFYNSLLPIRPVEDGFEMVSVIPRGLKTKPPKK